MFPEGSVFEHWFPAGAATVGPGGRTSLEELVAVSGRMLRFGFWSWGCFLPTVLPDLPRCGKASTGTPVSPAITMPSFLITMDCALLNLKPRKTFCPLSCFGQAHFYHNEKVLNPVCWSLKVKCPSKKTRVEA